MPNCIKPPHFPPGCGCPIEATPGQDWLNADADTAADEFSGYRYLAATTEGKAS